MPRPDPGPQLVLYGPDSKFGAKRKAGFSRYLWYITYREGGQRREYGLGLERSQRAAAETAFVQFISSRRPKLRGETPPDQFTVNDALMCYLEEHGPQAVDSDRIAFAAKALTKAIGEKTLAQMTAKSRRDYCRLRTKPRRVRVPGGGHRVEMVPVAPMTLVRELATLDAAARYCVREGYLSAYGTDQWFPERPEPKERYLDPQEAAALLRAAKRPPPDYRAPSARWHLPLFILIGLYTGRRKESILTLQWQPNPTGGYVDLERGYIDFYAQDQRRTKKRRGIIKIPERLMTFLRYARARTTTYVIEYEGRPVKSIRRSFSTACRAAGLEGVHPHILRHTLATWLAQRGVPPREAADYLEMTLETYERRYRKYHPDHQSMALAALR